MSESSERPTPAVGQRWRRQPPGDEALEGTIVRVDGENCFAHVEGRGTELLWCITNYPSMYTFLGYAPGGGPTTAPEVPTGAFWEDWIEPIGNPSGYWSRCLNGGPGKCMGRSKFRLVTLSGAVLREVGPGTLLTDAPAAPPQCESVSEYSKHRCMERAGHPGLHCDSRSAWEAKVMPATAEQTARDDSGSRPTKPAQFRGTVEHGQKRVWNAGGQPWTVWACRGDRFKPRYESGELGADRTGEELARESHLLERPQKPSREIGTRPQPHAGGAASFPKREVSHDGRTWIDYTRLTDADPFDSYRHRRLDGVVAAIVETRGVVRPTWGDAMKVVCTWHDHQEPGSAKTVKCERPTANPDTSLCEEHIALATPIVEARQRAIDARLNPRQPSPASQPWGSHNLGAGRGVWNLRGGR